MVLRSTTTSLLSLISFLALCPQQSSNAQSSAEVLQALQANARALTELSTNLTNATIESSETTNETLGEQQDEDPFGGGDDGGDDPWAKYNWDAEAKILHFTGALSSFGSGWIILEVLRDRKKRRLCYHRILLGLSIFDFLSSFWFFIGNWAHGESAGFLGTQPSPACETSGFFIYLGSLCIPMYNVALAAYFFLTVKHGWRESKLRKSFERFVHLPICLTGIAIAIVPIPLDMYNSWYSYCYVVHSVEDRGIFRQTKAFQWIAWVILFTSALLVTVLMILIYVYVKKVLKQSLRHALASSSVEFTPSPSSLAASGGSSNSQRLMESVQTKTRQVRNMAFLYSVPFYATWIVPNLWFLLIRYSWNGNLKIEPTPRCTFWMGIYISTLLSLQGFFNWMIYIFPRFQRIRMEQPSWTLPKVLKNVFGKIFRSRGDTSQSGEGSVKKMEKKESAKEKDNHNDDDDDDNNNDGDDDEESIIGSMMESIYIHFESLSAENSKVSDAYNSNEPDTEDVIHA